MRQLLGTCELALDQLKTSMRKILNGALKAQITEWWLKKIETKVLDNERDINIKYSGAKTNIHRSMIFLRPLDMSSQQCLIIILNNPLTI